MRIGTCRLTWNEEKGWLDVRCHSDDGVELDIGDGHKVVHDVSSRIVSNAPGQTGFVYDTEALKGLDGKECPWTI